MRVYSVLWLTVTIAFLANSAVVAAHRDEEAEVSKQFRGENADRRRLITEPALGDDVSEIGELVEGVMHTNAHVKNEMAKWCADVVRDWNELKRKGLKTRNMRHSSTSRDQLVALKTFYKDYMMAKSLAQKKMICDDRGFV
ncbi:unnamed protein product [Peronospora destructor]|uniref:RxLR effector protein n=1 Tax=Peronospora destructor TaxID=86335 RepID=A0AAV0V4R3_9STRA|nr:unnamed protein product [Peronospora destructor]